MGLAEDFGETRAVERCARVPVDGEPFDGNTAETTTIVPMLTSFMAAHVLPEVTVVADAGMMSEANLKHLEDAGLRFIVGARIPVPYQVKKWRQQQHPDQPIPDGHLGPKTDQRMAFGVAEFFTGTPALGYLPPRLGGTWRIGRWFGRAATR